MPGVCRLVVQYSIRWCRPNGPLFNTRANTRHFPTEHHSKRVTQEERQKQGGGEEKRAGSPSPTPQHVYRPGSVMCPQAGHQPAIVTEGGIKPPKLSHCHYQKNLSAKVWLMNSVLPGCGDQNRSLWREDTRIWTGLVTPYRIKWLGKAT